MEVLHFKCVKDGGKVFGVELHVDDGTNDGFHSANLALYFRCIGAG